MANYYHLLIIDDDPLGLMNYLDILEDNGFHAIGADSLAQARRELSRQDFDLIISDHDLGDGKGVTLIRQLQDSGRHLPVIYLSAAAPELLAEAAAISLVRLVMSKPVTPEQLLDAVKNLLPAESPLPSDAYPQVIGPEERDLLLNFFNRSENGTL